MRFDFDQVFDEDYLFFYERRLTPERNDQQVEVVSRLLGLQPGMRVLDLACGHGRIANRLAERGVAVVGLDASELFLDLAKADASRRKVKVEYILGDMRNIGRSAEFDAIINVFTSFGYFDEEGNRKVFESVYQALKPGGRFLIEHVNRDRIIREFQPVILEERDGQYMIDRNTYEPSTGCTHTERLIIRNGRARKVHFAIRLFTFPELRDWLKQAGLEEARVFDEQGQEYSLSSRTMVVVARKPGS